MPKANTTINRRSLLIKGAAASTVVAGVTSAKAAKPVFAPSELGREMLALTYERRQYDARDAAADAKRISTCQERRTG
jgi:hypothetical protein